MAIALAYWVALATLPAIFALLYLWLESGGGTLTLISARESEPESYGSRENSDPYDARISTRLYADRILGPYDDRS